MKLATVLLAFAMTLTLSAHSVAEETHSQGAQHTEKAGDHQSNDKGGEGDHGAAGGHGGGHGGLSEKMNALFPQPKQKEQSRDVPAKPELSSPAYFSKIEGGKATLQWKAVPGADEYHVQVATDPNFKWLAANEYHHTATSFEATNLEPGKHYYWRVAAVATGNWSTFRKSYFAMSMFETPGTPAAPAK